MRTIERVIVLAASLAAGTGVGTANAASPHPDSTASTASTAQPPDCAKQLSTPAPAAGALAATVGAAGATRLYGQGSAGMTAPLSYTFEFADGSAPAVQNTPMAFVKARLAQSSSTKSRVWAFGGHAYCAVSLIYTAPGSTPCFLPPELLGSDYVGSNPEGAAGVGESFTAIMGHDRYETAAGIANLGSLWLHGLPIPGVGSIMQENRGLFGLASGTSAADALTGGAAMAVQHAPILLTDRDYFPPSTASYIRTWTTQSAPNTFEADIFGGTAAVAQGLQDALTAKIKP